MCTTDEKAVEAGGAGAAAAVVAAAAATRTIDSASGISSGASALTSHTQSRQAAAGAARTVLVPTPDELSSDDESDMAVNADGWEDDDPIRAKVGSLLAKYGSLDGVGAASYSREAARAVQQQGATHTGNSRVEDALPTVVFDEGEYVVIDATDVCEETSTETSLEPQSMSDGVSDANDSFENLTWDDDSITFDAGNDGGEVKNAMLMSELRAAVAASLATLDVKEGSDSSSSSSAGGASPPPSRPFVADSPATFGEFSSNQSQRISTNEFDSFTSDNPFASLGRYPRMFSLQDDECSDSLSIITELTEPDNGSVHFSSQSNTPTDSLSGSKSSTPVQGSRASTPSTIDVLDEEYEVIENEMAHQLLADPVRAEECFGAASQTDSDQNVSECSGTESSPENHLTRSSDKVRPVDARRDSFDMLAERSLTDSSAVDFADVYEANKTYADMEESDFVDNDVEVTFVDTNLSANDQGHGKVRIKEPLTQTAKRGRKAANNESRGMNSQQTDAGTKRISSVQKPETDVAQDGAPGAKKKKAEKKKTQKDGHSRTQHHAENSKTQFAVEADELAQEYKDVRKNLAHVVRDEAEPMAEKRRKMSDGVVVDNAPLASLHKLTQLFDKDPSFMRGSSPRPNKKQAPSTGSSHGESANVPSAREPTVVGKVRSRNRESYVLDVDEPDRTSGHEQDEVSGHEDHYVEGGSSASLSSRSVGEEQEKLPLFLLSEVVESPTHDDTEAFRESGALDLHTVSAARPQTDKGLSAPVSSEERSSGDERTAARSQPSPDDRIHGGRAEEDVVRERESPVSESPVRITRVLRVHNESGVARRYSSLDEQKEANVLDDDGLELENESCPVPLRPSPSADAADQHGAGRSNFCAYISAGSSVREDFAERVVISGWSP